MVKLAEEGVELSPSTAARHRLIYALQARGHEELNAREPAYANYAAATRHVLHPSLAVQMAAEYEALRPAVLAHPDVRRALELYVAQHERFPMSPDTWDWLMLRHTHAEVAESLAPLPWRTTGIVFPWRSTCGFFRSMSISVCRRYAYLKCAGKVDEARSAWMKLREAGIPLGDEVIPP
jgi:hypothetical protein